MPEIVTRAEAKARGLKRYFTGKPCDHGHISERLVSHSRCIECRRIGDRVRLRSEKYLKRKQEWRKKNRDHLRRKNSEWQSRNYEKVRKISRDSSQRNRDKIRIRAKIRYDKISDLFAVLREEMPDLLKEIGL